MVLQKTKRVRSGACIASQTGAPPALLHISQLTAADLAAVTRASGLGSPAGPLTVQPRRTSPPAQAQDTAAAWPLAAPTATQPQTEAYLQLTSQYSQSLSSQALLPANPPIEMELPNLLPNNGALMASSLLKSTAPQSHLC